MANNEKCCAGDGDIIEDESLQPVLLDSTSILQMSGIFKALGDDRRLAIVKMIADEPEICSCTILERMDMAQPTLSHHMRILVSSGAINAYRKGKWMHYTLSEAGMKSICEFIDFIS